VAVAVIVAVVVGTIEDCGDVSEGSTFERGVDGTGEDAVVDELVLESWKSGTRKSLLA